MLRPVTLAALATAVPPNRVRQGDAAAAAAQAFGGRYEEFGRMSKVFESSGIAHRNLVRPVEWYFGTLGWSERNAVYLEATCDLFVEAATAALDRAGLLASDVDTIVTISSTGVATPSIDARVGGRMGWRADVERVPVFGLGCAGGVSGMAIGARLAASRPGSVVLVVAVELCSIAFRMDKLTKENIVATALFADGAAACILRAGEEDGIGTVEMAGTHTWPETLDIMGWSVDDVGLGVIFDRAIPPFAEREVGGAVTAILARRGLSIAEVDRFICHPGGAKVVTALERALALPQGILDVEREVLADHGNMSAPTVLFVLDRLLARGLPSRSVLTAMGPGFTASCLSLRTAA